MLAQVFAILLALRIEGGVETMASRINKMVLIEDIMIILFIIFCVQVRMLIVHSSKAVSHTALK